MEMTTKTSSKNQLVSSSFKDTHTIEQCQIEAKRILDKYPDRMPVIVERSPKSEPDIPDIDKKKFLVPDLTVGQFVYTIRKRIKLMPEKALFLHFNNKLYSTSDLMRSVYEQEKDPERLFLFVTYSGENSFG
jgi:GABA(A) receptor-associated protein